MYGWLIHLWTHFKTKMQCQRGFVITSAVAGSALLVGTAATATAASTAGILGGVAGAVTLASTGIGLATAAAVYTGAYFGIKGLMGGGGDQPQQQQQPGFDPYAEQNKATAAAKEETKRRRVAIAKNQTNLSRGEQEEAKLGTTGLLGS